MEQCINYYISLLMEMSSFIHGSRCWRKGSTKTIKIVTALKMYFLYSTRNTVHIYTYNIHIPTAVTNCYSKCVLYSVECIYSYYSWSFCYFGVMKIILLAIYCSIVQKLRFCFSIFLHIYIVKFKHRIFQLNWVPL